MGPDRGVILLPQQNSSSRRTRTRGGAAQTSGTADTGGAGEFGVQIGVDGADPAVGVGGNLTVDLSDGDIGLRVAPGVSIDLTGN